MQLIGLIFIKGHKNESQEKVKKKFDIGVVLWVKHVVLWVYWDEISEICNWVHVCGMREMRERRGKQTIAFIAVTFFTIC